jgi:hypothetical protein
LHHCNMPCSLIMWVSFLGMEVERARTRCYEQKSIVPLDAATDGLSPTKNEQHDVCPKCQMDIQNSFHVESKFH